MKNDEKIIFYIPKICEGQMVPHAHKDDALEYRYLDNKGNADFTSMLCSRCVSFDRARGYTLERTFGEEKTRFATINSIKWYPNSEEEDRD